MGAADLEAEVRVLREQLEAMRSAMERKQEQRKYALASFIPPRTLLLGLMCTLAGACCVGVSGTGTASFDSISVSGSCTGCGTNAYVVTDQAATFGESSIWAKKKLYESNAITVTNAAVGDICTVSPKDQLTAEGTNRAHSLYCYVSAANTVKVALAIGSSDITEGNGAAKIADGFGVNIAVIDATT